MGVSPNAEDETLLDFKPHGKNLLRIKCIVVEKSKHAKWKSE